MFTKSGNTSKNHRLGVQSRKSKLVTFKQSFSKLVCCNREKRQRRFQGSLDTNKMSTSVGIDNDNNRTRQFFCGVVEGFYGRPWSTEQRKELFKRMNKMGLNTYLYAPKDDSKHRSFWRELYSVEEADHLTSLIDAAREYNVTFVYALSPGLDMTFSSPKEVTFLKKKLEQVSTFGCGAFALLFDDIEPELCEADKQVFQSFAQAQVSVTNEVYQHLNQPRFLYCPTEYCASRAVPSVQKSEYLNTIGTKLLPDIDIMWTGPKVISKKISIESIEELSKVLRRPPVIWDNIHANDYDQKRLFLGPYHGRSTDLIPYLNGVLTNPNCEFEANYIALHTLAQWSKHNQGVKKDLVSNEKSSIASDIALEQEGEVDSVGDDPCTTDGYCPRVALQIAIKDWLEEMYRRMEVNTAAKICVPSAGAPTDLPVPIVPAPVNTCMTLTPTTTSLPNTSPLNTLPFTGITNANQLDRLDGDGSDSYMQPVTKEIVNSLVDASSSFQCNSPVAVVPLPPEPMDAEPEVATSDQVTDELKETEVMQVENVGDISVAECDRLSADDVALLVDLFYMPFEHGAEGVKLLTDFHWLKTNSHSLVQGKARKNHLPETVEWHDKAKAFGESVKRVSDMCDRLIKIPHRGILYDLYPYIWDMRGVLGLLNSFAKWLGSTKGYKDAFVSGDQEPWVFRGGLTGELQRLLPCEGAYDLFNIKVPDTPNCKVFTIRPYLPSDESAVYNVCLKTCEDGFDGTDVFASHPELIADKLVGGFLTVSPEYCFVLEDDEGVCGYVLAAPDARIFYKKVDASWIPAMRAKYEKPSKQEGLTPCEEAMASFHSMECTVPEALYKQFPSVLRMNIITARVDDPAVPKRLLTCLFSALKASGTHGIHAEIQIGDKYMVDFYSRLGFLDVPAVDSPSNEVLVLGRLL